MIIQTWGEVLRNSFQYVWTNFISFVPNLLIAVIIFVVGWAVGVALSKVIAQLVRSLKLDNALRAAGVDDVLRRGGITLNSGMFLGELVKWFIILVFLIASFDVLGLAQVNLFLQGVVINYLPQVIAAVLILLVAAVLGEAMRKVVTHASQAAGIRSANLLGSITKWSIWIFAILAALTQLGIAVALIQTLFTGAVIALSLAIGLSFGLGGQEAARDYIHKMRQEIK